MGILEMGLEDDTPGGREIRESICDDIAALLIDTQFDGAEPTEDHDPNRDPFVVISKYLLPESYLDLRGREDVISGTPSEIGEELARRTRVGVRILDSLATNGYIITDDSIYTEPIEPITAQDTGLLQPLLEAYGPIQVPDSLEGLLEVQA